MNLYTPEIIALATTILGAIAAYLKYQSGKSKEKTNQNNSTTVNVNQTVGSVPTDTVLQSGRRKYLKSEICILFVDDDTKFRVTKVLATSGWTRTSIQKDISSLDETVVKDAHIIFVDIQGVGRKLEFKDEGLGLALALKNKYGEQKIVVIYSSEQTGDRFHEGLRNADDFLRKSAEPYEFERLIEKHFEIQT